MPLLRRPFLAFPVLRSVPGFRSVGLAVVGRVPYELYFPALEAFPSHSAPVW
ncbi:MAG: hypothetical protein KME45_30855 [Stenomitos rutilans HA7619-LM2]|nr:hypothetical protein [Stenomitos rutilans HA7619-LM2]